MPWNKDGSRKKSTLYKKSNFKLRSGNDASPAKVILGEEEKEVEMNTTLIDLTKDMYESENQSVDTEKALEIIRDVEDKKKEEEEED